MISSFFLFFFIYFLRIPVHNYDFWWHLATGKYIVENNSLPQNDPFAYTANNDLPSERKNMILKGNWLAELIFYKFYSKWDLKGIIILRALLLLLFLLFIFLLIKKQNASDLIALVFTTGVFLTTKIYSGERPQLFTFLVFSIVFYLLEDFRINKSRKVFIIPFLVMLLANTHPGYIICIMLVTLYLAGEGARHFLRKDYKDSLFKGLLIVWGLTVVFSMLNPNHATILTHMFSSIQGAHIKGIVEFMPPFNLYLNRITPLNYSYIAFLLLSILSLKYIRRTGIIHLLLLTVFTIISFTAIRYVIFYMCISAPIIARVIINLKDEKVLQKLLAKLNPGKGFLNIMTCIIGILLVFSQIPAFARSDFRAETFYFVPKSAADFLGSQKIKGKMFNEYGFGGYLLWRLYPDRQVFIDGRGLEPEIYSEYQVVTYAVESPVVSWKDIIEKYNISHIIMPALLHHGDVYPIVEKLLASEDWALIYIDHLSLIFLRNNPDNSSIIKKLAMDKSEGLKTIIIQASAKSLKNPVNPYFLITLGKVFFKMGKLDDAEKAFMIAYERAPDNKAVKEWLKKVKAKRKNNVAVGPDK